MNWETYQKTYQEASPTIRELVDSEQIPLCSKNALEKRNLLLLRKKVAAEIASNTVGAQTIDETLENLIKLGVTDALQFVAEVQTCIRLGATPSTETKPASPPENLTSEITAAKKELESLQTVRTMPHDMAVIKPGSDVVYQSSQADILSRSAGEAPNIASAAPEAPRWDTETQK